MCWGSPPCPNSENKLSLTFSALTTMEIYLAAALGKLSKNNLKHQKTLICHSFFWQLSICFWERFRRYSRIVVKNVHGYAWLYIQRLVCQAFLTRWKGKKEKNKYKSSLMQNQEMQFLIPVINAIIIFNANESGIPYQWFKILKSKEYSISCEDEPYWSTWEFQFLYHVS